MYGRSSGFAVVFFWAIAQVACGGDTPPGLPASYPFAPDAGQLSAFSDVFEVVDSLKLEENDSVVVATPVVSFDGERFLMADVHSFQVREYAVDGSLLFAAGRRGGGPGEYLAPMRASRALDGGIRVIDGPAMRSTYYPPSAPRDPRTEALLFSAYKQIDLGVDHRLVAGSALSHTPGQPTPMLHIWNVRTGDIERSFLTDPFPKHLEPVTVSKRAVDVTVRRDTIWAVSAFVGQCPCLRDGRLQDWNSSLTACSLLGSGTVLSNLGHHGSVSARRGRNLGRAGLWRSHNGRLYEVLGNRRSQRQPTSHAL